MQAYLDAINNSVFTRSVGKVCDCIGLTVRAEGLDAFVGEHCEIYSGTQTQAISAEVIGIKDGRILLMPYGHISGISVGSEVVATGRRVEMPVGDSLLGRVLDAFGQPLDGKPAPLVKQHYSLYGQPQNPLERPLIKDVIHTGVKVIDGLLTVGKGQRMGLFAGSGVGKSTLLGMIAKDIEADVNVIALVGERGREVSHFVQDILGEEGLKKSVVIAATSDENALVRAHAAWGATTIAEYFRDQGKHVVLTMDSVTRFAMAQREIGLSIGEPPTARGYTPSVFAMLPRLLERGGTHPSGGSITAFYTVLVDGDDNNEPIADQVRSILDGGIYLSRKLANKRHFPSIDVLQSSSRLIDELISAAEYELVRKFVGMLELYERYQEMIDVGVYKSGANPKLDDVISRLDSINSFLTQKSQDSVDRSTTIKLLRKVCA